MRPLHLLFVGFLVVTQAATLTARPPLQPFPPLIGRPAAEVMTLIHGKLPAWNKKGESPAVGRGTVMFQREDTTLALQVTNGKIAAVSIAKSAGEAGEAREREAREALRVASEESPAAVAESSALDEISRKQKQHLDALLKEGFTRSEAIQIIAGSDSLYAPESAK